MCDGCGSSFASQISAGLMRNILSAALRCEIVVRSSFVGRPREEKRMEKARQSESSLRRNLKSKAFLRALQVDGLNTLISFVLVCCFRAAALSCMSSKERIICMVL